MPINSVGPKFMVALVASKEADRHYYLDILKKYSNLKVQVFTDPKDFQNSARVIEYSGVVMDFTSIIMGAPNMKTFINEINDYFPILKIRKIQKENGHTISGSYGDQQIIGEKLIESYINDVCKKETLKVRQFKRFPTHFNILFDTNEDFLHPIETNTVNVSKEGCFILSPHVFEEVKYIWMKIDDIPEMEPIKCEVKWCLPWGKTWFHLPGYGISFIDLPDNILNELLSLAIGN